jgi:hypothetical protein
VCLVNSFRLNKNVVDNVPEGEESRLILINDVREVGLELMLECFGDNFV